jgi:alanine racemase
LRYTISDIVEIIKAKLLQGDTTVAVDTLLLDSRKVLFPHSSLFFALDGPRRKGLDFIDELYQKGVRSFVIAEQLASSVIHQYPQANFLLVENVLQALQSLAADHRKKFNYPVIGITGSNGKTIVKEWLYQLLGDNFHIVRSPKSYNSQIGVPLSVWQMKPEHTLGIFEAGISQPGEMNQLQSIIQPTIGVLTFMGDAHAEGFDSLQQKINEKLTLFHHCESIVYSADDSMVADSVKTFSQQVNRAVRLFSWGHQGSVDLCITYVDKKNTETIIHATYVGTDFNFTIPFTDEASIFNAMTCAAVMLSMNLSTTAIALAMKELRSVAMRLELKQGISQCSIINDSYSSDINSLTIALDFLMQQNQHPKKTVILSDMLQSGKTPESLYLDIANILQQKNLFRFIGIGPEMAAHTALFSSLPNVQFYSSTEEFLKKVDVMQFQNEAILLKGARLFAFEKIGAVLEQKIHETVLEINLNALRSNLSIYRKALQPSVKLMAMVKAFSYGSGSYEIANLLQQEGIDYLGVAYTDEGVELRKAGIQSPIMVMNTTPIGFENLVTYQLEPELYSFSILKAFKSHLLRHQITRYPIHIKLDTGMHRLGFMPEEVTALSDLLTQDDTFVVRSVFSHLVASENPAEDAFTQQQGMLFEKMAQQIESAIGYSCIKHIANTSAIKRHPSLQFNMVRLGIGLYGIDSQYPVELVTTLKTTISQIKRLPQGATVGYGRRGVLHQDATIATVRIGYADGYARSFSNGEGKMLVNGQLAPVIGNVCMDMTMLDITGIPALEGDEVIIFGKDLSVTTMAGWAHTIPYEILTNISHRVKRVYFQE